MPIEDNPKEICHSSTCGSNTYCSVFGNRPICKCIEEYNGDPYSTGCRPECLMNTDCPGYLSCINSKCQDPCREQICAVEAQCRVSNHIIRCECSAGTTGDPFRYCGPIQQYTPPIEKDVCSPSPCGINSQCRKSGSSFVCECLHGYLGNAYGYGCSPECSSNSDCPLSKSCFNQRCIDPCVNVCGYNAR